jgi:putative transposase
VPARRRKRQRLGTSPCPADRLAAEHPNHVWALDYQFDQTRDGRILKLLNIVDEHTREALTIAVDRRIDADTTVSVLDGLVAERGTTPRFIRCDNDPELTANALRDWCRFIPSRDQLHRARRALAEPLCGELRRPAPRRAARRRGLQQPARGQVLVEDWRIEYNTVRPHSAPGYLTPTDYAKA